MKKRYKAEKETHNPEQATSTLRILKNFQYFFTSKAFNAVFLQTGWFAQFPLCNMPVVHIGRCTKQVHVAFTLVSVSLFRSSFYRWSSSIVIGLRTRNTSFEDQNMAAPVPDVPWCTAGARHRGKWALQAFVCLVDQSSFFDFERATKNIRYFCIITLTGIPRQVWRNFKCHCIQEKSTPGKSFTRPNSLHLPAISRDYDIIGQRFIVVDKTAILGYPGMHHIQEFISQALLWSDEQKVVYPSQQEGVWVLRYFW